MQSKNVTITQNGTQTISPDEGYNGISQVNLTANVEPDWSDFVYDTIGPVQTVSGQAIPGYQLAIKKVHIPSQVNGTSAYRMFYLYPWELIDGIENLDVSNVKGFEQMFSQAKKLTNLNLSNWNTSSATSMEYMFSGCNNLQAITFGNNFNTSNVTSMTYMFSSCSNLTNLDLSSFNTSKVTDCSVMFSGCTNLTNLDVSNFNLSKFRYNRLQNTFANCPNLSNNSLNSILKMISTLPVTITSDRTLKFVGLSSAQATTCTTLSNWADAQTAGWTTGY